MNSFLELAKGRRSVRLYRPEPVPPLVIRRLLEAARSAPSGLNVQPWEFVVVTDETLRAQVGRNAFYYGIYSPHVGRAPVIIAVCMNRRRGPFARDDCCIAATHLLLAAADLGLGACWVGGLRREAVRRSLGVPEGMQVLCLVTVGYPAEKPRPTPRRDLASMVHWNGWQSRRPRSGARSWGPLSVLGHFLRVQMLALRRPKGKETPPHK